MILLFEATKTCRTCGFNGIAPHIILEMKQLNELIKEIVVYVQHDLTPLDYFLSRQKASV